MSSALAVHEPKASPPYISSRPTQASHLPPDHPYKQLLDLISPSTDSIKALNPRQRLHQRLRQHFDQLCNVIPPDQPTFKHWFRLCWLDILTQLLCALLSLIIYLAARPLAPRFFPLYPGIFTSPWGQKYGQPYRSEFVTTPVSAAVSFFVPFAIMSAVSGLYVRSFWDANAACISLGYALSLATLITTLFKWLVGGFRPHFLAVCDPLVPPPFEGINRGAWYSAEVCRGDPHEVREAQMSFPSGHSSAAFAGFGFLALYLNARLGVVGGERGEGERWYERHWKMVVCAAPVVVAGLIAGSKVVDGWHHPVDVAFGSLIGVVCALVAWGMGERRKRKERGLEGLTDGSYVV